MNLQESRFASYWEFLAACLLLLAVFVGAILGFAGIAVFWVAFWRRDGDLLFRSLFYMALGWVIMLVAARLIGLLFPEKK